MRMSYLRITSSRYVIALVPTHIYYNYTCPPHYAERDGSMRFSI